MKQKKHKCTKNERRCFLESNFRGFDRLFALFYSNQRDSAKTHKVQIHYLPKDIIKNYDIIINGKNFSDYPINSDIKRYKGATNLTT